MSDPRVLVLDQDIYKYAQNLDDITEYKTFRKDKLISNQYNLNLDNSDNYFSIDNTNSIFFNIQWWNKPIKIYDENDELVWDGIIIDVQRNHQTKRAVLISKSSLTTVQKEIIDYQSSDWETGAEAFANICDGISYTNYNGGAQSKSHNILDDAGAYMKCNFNTSDGVTFQRAIEKIAEYSGADIYMHRNNIYFSVWEEYSNEDTISIIEKDIKNDPFIASDYKNIINDYSIGYDGDNDTPATDSANNNIGQYSRSEFGIKSLPELKTSASSDQIQFKDLTTAVFIGELFIKRTNKNYGNLPRPRTKCKLDVYDDITNNITLESYIDVTFTDENWDSKIFEVYKFTIDKEKRNLSIEGYEV